jgi:uncharacterized linocin/CFP29 family protein
MSQDLLRRSFAPLGAAAWQQVDRTASDVLQQNLAGRKLVDFTGPLGWQFGALNTGRIDLLEESPVPEVGLGLRRVLPLVELRAPIRLAQSEIDSVARGAEDPDLQTLVQAAKHVAQAEDAAVFNGYAPAGISGIIPSSPHEPIAVSGGDDWPRAVVAAQEKLRRAGVTGPSALAMGTRCYDELLAATSNGYPVIRQLDRHILGGPIVHAPSILHAVLLAIRGGDYQLVVGEDLSVGYASHDRDWVELYLTESFTFRVLEPAAAVALLRSEEA